MAVSAASKADKSQERFENALRELFVGAEVEGQSGFINLMRIKSRYYTDGVFPKLQKDIEAALKPACRDDEGGAGRSFPGFRQELFDKLYDFFHRRFSPSGSIYFQHTPAHYTFTPLCVTLGWT
jgi:adenine-specific DNA-methyltransferase